jgi:hypothetical protein
MLFYSVHVGYPLVPVIWWLLLNFEYRKLFGKLIWTRLLEFTRIIWTAEGSTT